MPEAMLEVNVQNEIIAYVYSIEEVIVMQNF